LCAQYGVLSEFCDLLFVPAPVERQHAQPTLQLQYFASITSLLLLFQGSVHEVHAHLFMVKLICCCRLCSSKQHNISVLCKLSMLPGQQHILQQTTEFN
jgi:hypothetical protein